MGTGTSSTVRVFPKHHQAHRWSTDSEGKLQLGCLTHRPNANRDRDQVWSLPATPGWHPYAQMQGWPEKCLHKGLLASSSLPLRASQQRAVFPSHGRRHRTTQTNPDIIRLERVPPSLPQRMGRQTGCKRPRSSAGESDNSQNTWGTDLKMLGRISVGCGVSPQAARGTGLSEGKKHKAEEEERGT